MNLRGWLFYTMVKQTITESQDLRVEVGVRLHQVQTNSFNQELYAMLMP